jgi:Uma2 family endonuclease
MSVQERTFTIAEFWDIVERPENAQKRLELIEGAIVEVPPSSPTNSMIAMWIGHLRVDHVLPTKSGYVTGPDAGYELGPNTVVQPDAAYISKVRAGSIPKKVFATAPDLVVEVISPSETVRAVLDKARLYLHAGSQLVLAVDAETKKVDAYRLATNGELRVQTLGVTDTLDASEALPGFRMKVQDLFAVIES